MKYILCILSIIFINVIFKIIDFESITTLTNLEVKIINKLILFLLTIIYLYSYFKISKSLFFNKLYFNLFLCSFIFSLSYYILFDFDFEKKFTTFTIYCLSTSLFEEFFSRILVFLILLHYLKNQIKKSIIISSVFFGVLHLLNLLTENVIILSVFSQVILATVIGYFLTAILLKSKNIFIPIITHFIMNFFGSYNTIFSEKELTNNYNFNSFLSTLLFIVIISMFLIPLSNFFIKSEMETWEKRLTYEK